MLGAIGQSYWWELLVRVVDWISWLPLLAGVVGCDCWSDLQVGVVVWGVTQNHPSELFIAEVLISPCLLKVLVHGVVRWFCWS